MNNKKLQEGLEFLNRIKLLMEYDMSKTLKENKLVLEQEPESRFETQQTKDIVKTGEQDRIETEKQQKENEIQNTYPNFCSAREFAQKIPENCGGIKQGNDLKILNEFCYYKTPPVGNSKVPNGIFIPKDAKIYFHTVDSINRFYHKILKTYNKVYSTDAEKKELLNLISFMIPEDTVQSFEISGMMFEATLRSKSPLYEWKFAGYQNNNNAYYETPYCVDTRNETEKWFDEYKDFLLFGSMIAGLFVPGEGWLYTALRLTEMLTFTGMAIRHWQKGENISAFFDLIFITMPYWKNIRWFRGISKQVWEELRQAVKGKKFESPVEYQEFYESLSEPAKLGRNKIVRRDEISKKIMIDELKSILDNEMPSRIFEEAKLFFEQNPDKIIRIKFWQRIWARELGGAGLVFLIDILLNVVLGDTLNNEEKAKLEKIAFVIPQSLFNELSQNMINNTSEAVKNFTNITSEEQLKQMSEKGFYEGINNMLKYNMEQTPGAKWNEIPEDSVHPLKDEDEDEYEKLKKQGWVTISVDDLIKNNIPQDSTKYYMGNFLVEPKNIRKYDNLENQDNQGTDKKMEPQLDSTKTDKSL
jgi:hypothetical protein